MRDRVTLRGVLGTSEAEGRADIAGLLRRGDIAGHHRRRLERDEVTWRGGQPAMIDAPAAEPTITSRDTSPLGAPKKA